MPKSGKDGAPGEVSFDMRTGTRACVITSCHHALRCAQKLRHLEKLTVRASAERVSHPPVFSSCYFVSWQP